MREKEERMDIQSEAYAGKPTMPQSVLIIGVRFARKHVSIARVPKPPQVSRSIINKKKKRLTGS